MIDVTRDIHSMTAFKRDSTGFMKRMNKSGRPLGLTVIGKPEAVVLDAAPYRDVAGHLDAIASAPSKIDPASLAKNDPAPARGRGR